MLCLVPVHRRFAQLEKSHYNYDQTKKSPDLVSVTLLFRTFLKACDVERKLQGHLATERVCNFKYTCARSLGLSLSPALDVPASLLKRILCLFLFSLEQQCAVLAEVRPIVRHCLAVNLPLAEHYSRSLAVSFTGYLLLRDIAVCMSTSQIWFFWLIWHMMSYSGLSLLGVAVVSWVYISGKACCIIVPVSGATELQDVYLIWDMIQLIRKSISLQLEVLSGIYWTVGPQGNCAHCTGVSD